MTGDVFKALADETRRLILDELLQQPRQTLFELCARLAMNHGVTSSRQAVSQHLEVLEQAGLVHSRRDGRYKFHELDTAPLAAITRRWPPHPDWSAPDEPPPDDDAPPTPATREGTHS